MISPFTKNKERSVSTADSEAQRSETAESAPSEVRIQPAAGHSIDVKGLHAYYGAQESIKGIDIFFPANEVTAIIGPSGSGKSTVVR